jgi:hypothetical protein
MSSTAAASRTAAVSLSDADLARIVASADRRTLAAVVTHLSGDPAAVPDLRDRAHNETLAVQLLPAYFWPAA